MTVRYRNTIDFRRFGNVAADKTEFGFFQGATYPTGQSVAEVAAWNEFGTDTIPERPFFRNAVDGLTRTLPDLVLREFRNGGFNLDDASINRISEAAVSAVQVSITELDDPPNAPSTIRRKDSSSPLQDKGTLRRSVAYKVR